MSLREYQRKRDFNVTPEPRGQASPSAGSSYVIQKHQATHLHYDFRLELDGVLLSWAVPKGPSLDPKIKRLAMQVEDHPVAYGSFEGIIPQGQYGGGTVMLWDAGHWEPEGDARQGLASGRLKFTLHGTKLRGRWMLLRTGRKNSGEKPTRQWLLFKERDEFARDEATESVTQAEPRSVASDRTLEEIAAAGDRVWPSKATRNAPKPKTPSEKPEAAPEPRARAVGARKAPLPRSVEVQLATLVQEPPEGNQWIYEIKFDGYRLTARCDRGKVELLTRNQKAWTAKLPNLCEALKSLPAKSALLDGELVAVRADGTSDFQELQNAFRDGRERELLYYAFDLLYLDGLDLTGLPLDERKRRLAKLLASAAHPHLRLSEHLEGRGDLVLRQSCAMAVEGIICKRRDGRYTPGRGYDWLKVKCNATGEFVIGGYTAPAGAREHFGALLVGYFNDDGELIYAGKVGTGFDRESLADLFKRFQPLRRADSPFQERPKAAEAAQWLEPKLVTQVAYGSWTREGILRHPSFQGLREDKPAREVRRDRALPLASVEAAVPPQNGKVPRPRTEKAAATAPEEFMGVRLTSPAKLLYPEVGITKHELAETYVALADWMLPHLKDRPIVLVRCPEGSRKSCFYQKHPAVGSPENLRRVLIEEKDKAEEYLLIDDAQGLISMAQVGALELHAWGSRVDKLEYPDRLIFDLDPAPDVAWRDVIASARQLRAFLEDLGLESFVKTTGGKGLHLVVPVERRHTWDEVKDFCKRVADLTVQADPKRYTANMSKAARPGKIFVDYLRNTRGATAVAPYSPRSRENASVSVPLTWKELDSEVHSDHYTLRNIMIRLKRLKKDPWEGMASTRQNLSKPTKRLGELIGR